MKTLSKLILIIFFVLGMAGIAASDVSDILEAYFEAVGGLARLSEIRTVKRVANAQLTQFNGLSVNIPGIVEEAGSFNFKIFHFMRLTASIGFAAKSWSASVIFVCPVNRKTESAVFRIAAIT